MGLCNRIGTEPIPLDSRLWCFILLPLRQEYTLIVEFSFPSIYNLIMLPPVNFILVSKKLSRSSNGVLSTYPAPPIEMSDTLVKSIHN